jgi:hypothetical protein
MVGGLWVQDTSIANNKRFKGWSSIPLEVNNMYKISLWKSNFHFVISMFKPWVLAFYCVILPQNLPTWPMDNHSNDGMSI